MMRIVRDICLSLAAVSACCLPLSAAEPAREARFLQNGVTAHRGNSSEAPENTLPAFQSAIDLGADWIELDVRRSKDGKLVVSHDQDTGRVGDRNLNVADSTFEELKGVDVAADFRKRMGRSIGDCPPHTIPLLEDVLRLVMTQSKTRVTMQPKVDCVADVVALVQRLGANRWIGFNDGNLNFLAEARRLAPEAPIFWDLGARASVDDAVRIAKEHGFASIVLQERGLTPEKVQTIRAAGIDAGAWTVNDPERMKTLLDMGVNRIYTDHPRLLLALNADRADQGVQCEGVYPKHLQGACIGDDGAIFWSFTDVLVKTDRLGKLIKKVPVASHHGDLCHLDGKLYVAVNLGKFNQPAGKADSWVYTYDAETLKELSRHPAPEVVHGAGGIAYHDGAFLVVGGLPPGVEENYLYEYDKSLKFQKRHTLSSGYTLMGIQTAEFADGHWWFGCYGKPQVLLKADADYALVGRWEFDASLGIIGRGGGGFLVARGTSTKGKGCTGRLVRAVADDARGLRIVGQAGPAGN